MTAWEQRKFSEIVDVCSGRDYKHLNEGPIPVYGTGGYMTSVCEALSHNRDAVGIGRKGTIDKPYLLKAPFWTVDTLFYAIPKPDINLEFALCSFLNVDWKSKDESTGLPSLSKEAINKTVLRVPNAVEQNHLGSFFTDIDSLITLHQRKCQYRSLYGYLSWEQRKLGNCGTTYGGLSGKTKEDFGHGNARFVPYTNVFDNPLTDTKRLETVEIDSSQNKVAYGDTFFTVSSETPDEVGMSSVWLSDQDDVYLNSFCFGYRQDSTFDPHYLAYMLRSSSIRSDLTLLAQGISRFNISKNKVMELSVPVPSAAEQKQIGQYFARLDSLITLHQREPPHTMKEGKNVDQHQ